MIGLELDFASRPSVAAYMVRALYPGFLRRPLPFPPIGVRWRGAGPDRARLRAFERATGLGAGESLPSLFPQVLTFPLQMVILTHPAFPLPIWKVLQVRNQLLQRRPIPAGAAFDAEARVAGQRVLEKGVEVDLHVAVREGEDVAWEGLTTYYYRGRFGDPDPASPRAATPAEATGEVARWRTEGGGGLRFGGISGDYNGIHYMGPYARLFGFRGAFHHPYELVGQCLRRMATPPAPAERLELWFKGPVYYGSEVSLAVREAPSGVGFALRARAGARPALVGGWRAADPAEPLGETGGGSRARSAGEPRAL